MRSLFSRRLDRRRAIRIASALAAAWLSRVAISGGAAGRHAQFGKGVGGCSLAAIAGTGGIGLSGSFLRMESDDRGGKQHDEEHHGQSGNADPYALHHAEIPMDGNFRQPRAQVNRQYLSPISTDGTAVQRSKKAGTGRFFDRSHAELNSDDK